VLNFLDAESTLEGEGSVVSASANAAGAFTSAAASSAAAALAAATLDERDDILERELAASDRRVKKEIRHLEAEVSKWQVMVDNVHGCATSDFDNQTLAVLRGRLVRYLMRSKEITIGRSTKDSVVDVDLKLEGPAWKVSRRQGAIKLRSTGEFLIANEGKRPMFVDGRPVRNDDEMGCRQHWSCFTPSRWPT